MSTCTNSNFLKKKKNNIQFHNILIPICNQASLILFHCDIQIESLDNSFAICYYSLTAENVVGEAPIKYPTLQ